MQNSHTKVVGLKLWLQDIYISAKMVLPTNKVDRVQFYNDVLCGACGLVSLFKS